jgi:peptide/nickel transport system permease protein
MAVRVEDYVEAARAVGNPPWRIALVHILPNVLNSVVVLLTLQLGFVIIVEATLSFLGAGLVPPTPSWGIMIHDGYEAIFAHPYEVLPPAVAIALIMLSFSFIGDGLRDALDPRMRR